jgi:hypothetical protein
MAESDIQCTRGRVKNSTFKEVLMHLGEKDPTFGKVVYRLLIIFLFATLAVQPAKADNRTMAIPGGTILPVRLNSTISSARCKPGQVITGRIMQDVPLSSAATIRAGSKITGHIVDVIPATSGTEARVSFQFDKLVFSNQTISIVTNLRAIAGFVQVREADTPTTAPAEGDNFYALTTVQVGGDVVYGVGGPVTTAENSNQVVGKAGANGVLGQVRAREGAKCRGAIDVNDSPQALWVFSSDACGAYGLEHISIAHAGRTDPTGVIVLTSNNGKLRIPGGAGMLLRVTAKPQP